jgi:membrane-associated protein
MPMRRFMTYSAIGGVIWASGVTLLGYFLGNIDFVANNIELMLIAIVAVSLVPIAVEALRSRRSLRA